MRLRTKPPRSALSPSSDLIRSSAEPSSPMKSSPPCPKNISDDDDMCNSSTDAPEAWTKETSRHTDHPGALLSVDYIWGRRQFRSVAKWSRWSWVVLSGPRMMTTGGPCVAPTGAQGRRCGRTEAGKWREGRDGPKGSFAGKACCGKRQCKIAMNLYDEKTDANYKQQKVVQQQAAVSLGALSGAAVSPRRRGEAVPLPAGAQPQPEHAVLAVPVGPSWLWFNPATWFGTAQAVAAAETPPHVPPPQPHAAPAAGAPQQQPAAPARAAAPAAARRDIRAEDAAAAAAAVARGDIRAEHAEHMAGAVLELPPLSRQWAWLTELP